MIMCSRCHKRVAVVFVTKIENGEKINEGICIKCARELGLPVEGMLGDICKKLGISPEQLDGMEDDLNKMIEDQGGLPSDNDDNEDAGAPAIDFPKLFGENGIMNMNSADGEIIPEEMIPGNSEGRKKAKGKKDDEGRKFKFLDTYCRNLTKRAADGELDKVVGRDRELARTIQILCRRQKNNPLGTY